MNEMTLQLESLEPVEASTLGEILEGFIIGAGGAVLFYGLLFT